MLWCTPEALLAGRNQDVNSLQRAITIAGVSVLGGMILLMVSTVVFAFRVLRKKREFPWRLSCRLYSLAPILCVAMAVVVLTWAAKDHLFDGQVNTVIIAGFIVGVSSALSISAVTSRGRLYRGAILRSIKWGRPDSNQREQINRHSQRILNQSRLEMNNAIRSIISGHI